MAAADVDVGYLATHLGLPEQNLVTVTTDPTAELVKAILAAVAAKGHEYDLLFSQKLQLEVEFETSIRSAEAQRDASNEAAKRAQRDVEEIRQKLKQEETARQALENELQSIKSSSSTIQSEIETLRARIVSLETSNREAMAIIDTKNSANDTLSQELQAQHQKNLKLNQEITSIQQSVQNATNAANSAKFKEQSLRQELDMAQRSADFFEGELKTKTAEANKFRKEKTARITELVRQNEDLTADRDSKERITQQLRKQLEDRETKLSDALARNQQLVDTHARKEEDLRQDLDSTRRLVAMKDEQSTSQKKRLLEMETRLEQVKRDGEDAVRRISEELARAHESQDQASSEIETLHGEVGRLEAMLAGPRGSPSQPGSAPQTPRPLNGSILGRPGSPFATPGSVRKSISTTQALEELYKYKGMWTAEKQRNQHLAKEFDAMVDQLEAKGPEIDELQAENERLQQELQNLSLLSDESFKEREIAKKAARKAEAEKAKAQVEANSFRNDIRSLSAQLQMMIFQLEHQGQGLTPEEEMQLQQIERATGFTDGDMSDVNTLVTERLVVFRNIQDLQQKNQELLKVIHELSESMKNDEDAAVKQQAIEDHNENIRLRERIKSFEDELRTFVVRYESIVKERDMFRRMIDERRMGAELTSAIDGESGVLVSIEQNSLANDDGSDYPSLLRDLRQDYENLRTEHTVDRNTMKTQIETLSSQKNALQADNSRLSSQLSLKDQRYEMLESNFTAAKSENKELQKRIQTQSETIAKQDIRTQQVAEDLVEIRSQADGLRNENANLKAEKKLWKDIQDRLTQDNENLIQEKSRLNGLLATQQSLQNERDLSESETKRRLQGQVDTLESELGTVKRKLADEVEEGKKLQLRKEFDAQQSQKRIDELTSNLSQIREELVGTKTTRDHLQARVNELTIELSSAQERAERLLPRPTPRPGTVAPGTDQTATQDADERINDLIHEVADLKRDLELAKTHLENTRSEAERYKELSQSTEEQLSALTAAQDEYTQEMDASLAAKDSTIKELEQRVEDLSAELGRSNGELSTLRDSQADVARRFEEEKAILDDEIKRLRDQEENYTASSQMHQHDLRIQAEIASSAQQSYESEVAKHGETIKTLTSIRTEYNQLRTAAATLRAEAESAKATLLQNESSWDERRKKFEQEQSELRARRDDADKQNRLLHQQLESVTSQVTALQQSRGSANESLDAIAAQPTSTSEDGLREISNYLRREKDILEVQFDLKVREAKRLQESLDHTQSQLDDARLKLEQERRSQTDSERTSMSHKELMAKLEQLNVFRESNAALRAEKDQTLSQLSAKIERVNELEAKVQPLEAQVEELNSQLGHKEAEIKQIHEDRDRWQKRTEDILSKHGRTDPAEVEELKQTVASLEAERNALQEAEIPLKEKIQELENTIQEKETAWQTSREKLVAQFKERSRTLTTTIKEVTAEKERLQGETNATIAQITTIKEELESEKKEHLAMQEQIKSFQRQVQSLQEEALRTKSSVMEAPAAADSSSAPQVVDLERQLAEVKTELENVSAQKAGVEQELESLRGQLSAITAERDQVLANVQANGTNEDVPAESGTGAVFAPEATSAPLSDEERKALEQKIVEAETKAAEFEAKARELEENQTSIVNNRSEKMKTALNEKLRAKNAEIEKERTELKQQMEKHEENLKLRMEQERRIWEAEQMSTQTETKPPATPSQQAGPGTPTATPSTSNLNLDSISDNDARKFVATNDTVKAIITANIKNKVAEATKKLRDECEQNHVAKSEVDQKIAQAREQASKMAASKATLQVNMSQNIARTANAKLGVVEAAAKETPLRPVGEVWELAKVAKPLPPQPKQPAPATASNATATAAPSAVGASSQPTSTSNGAPSQVPKPAVSSGLPKPQAAATNNAAPGNPFSQSQQGQVAHPAAAAPTNPFIASNATSAAAVAHPAAQSQVSQTTTGAATAPPKSGIPAPSNLPKSNLRQPSGGFQTQGAGRGGGRGGRGGSRGGAQGQGRASLNPGADNFQPGTNNKRPRGDSEIGAGTGAKRLRGGAGAGQ